MSVISQANKRIDKLDSRIKKRQVEISKKLDTISERKTITTERAAELLGVTPKTINTWSNAGQLEYFKLSAASNSPRKIYLDSVIDYAKKVQGRVVVISD